MRRPAQPLSVAVALAAVLVGTWSCSGMAPLATASASARSSTDYLPAGSRPATFANFPEIPVHAMPSVPPYRVAADLKNVTNASLFHLPPQAMALLEKNGFVVLPGGDNEFFQTYEMNEYSQTPSFVTTDAMLHNYHLYFDHLLRMVEEKKMVPDLRRLTQTMLTSAITQYDSLKGTGWDSAARRNVAYFAVASRLLGSTAPVPAAVRAQVSQELRLINAHTEITPSPVMGIGQSQAIRQGLKEDYTQFVPRGHYTGSAALQEYFRAMTWYGTLAFRLNNADETRSAVLMTLAAARNDKSRDWAAVYGTSSLFAGWSDDLTPGQYMALLQKIYGNKVALGDLTRSPLKFTAFVRAARSLPGPRIASVQVLNTVGQANRSQAIKGFSFMGQRFTLDADIMQNLVYPDVGANAQGQERMLPKGLDIPAAMGSGEAYAILEKSGDTGFQNYPGNMTKLRSYLSGLPKTAWTEDLYTGWLYTLDALLPARGSGYPSFMQNTAWTDKGLDTYLGSWAELKHDTLLYTKQVYAEMGGPSTPVDFRGYVEPNPVFYARLAGLTRMTEQSLERSGLLGTQDKTNLQRLYELSLSLETISEKELANQPLTNGEYDLIKSFGGQLEHFWLDALKDEGYSDPHDAYGNPAETIADVATDTSSGTVLEEGTYGTSTIYVVVPVAGSLRIAVGAIYPYYEFTQPATDRLTDAEWRRMNPRPPLPSWTSTFTAPAPPND